MEQGFQTSFSNKKAGAYLSAFFSGWKDLFLLTTNILKWAAVSSITIAVALFALTFYMHVYPYGYSAFNRAEWLEQGQKGQAGDRCNMAGTVEREVLRPSMTRKEVQDILGPAGEPVYATTAGLRVFYYSLGMCSPIAWDPYVLKLLFDENDKLVQFANIQS